MPSRLKESTICKHRDVTDRRSRWCVTETHSRLTGCSPYPPSEVNTALLTSFSFLNDSSAVVTKAMAIHVVP